MRHKILLQIGTLGLIVFITLTMWASQSEFVSAKNLTADAPLVDSALLAKAKTDEPLDFLVYFKDQADLSGAYELPWEQRGWYVYNTLIETSAKSQAKVLKFLEGVGVPYEAFWAQNAIAVEGSTSATLFGLLNYGEIYALQSIPRVFLADADPKDPQAQDALISLPADNLLHIEVDRAWALGFNGEGIVVGSIDSGVRYTHEALIDAYRGNLGEGVFNHNYHWWDAVENRAEPYDDVGHGTHITGIMVGARSTGEEIGVATGASWVACKAIQENGNGLGTDFIKCGQFMIAPTNLEGLNPNPNLRPHVVNNSWGDCENNYDGWYEGVIDAWLAAGIYPVFANGNATNCGYDVPPGLGTVSNPARSPQVTAVGSTSREDGELASHSTWGPTDKPDTINPNGYPLIKPQVVAPGVEIPSAYASGDRDYAIMSGTSMAAPHVAGLVALMWEAGGCLVGDYATTETLLQESASPIPYDTSNGDEGPDLVPNHAAGWGEINALEAVRRAEAHCNGGYLAGHVLNAVDQNPIEGAKLQASAIDGTGREAQAITDEHGYFRLYVDSQTGYKVNIQAYGFHPGAIKEVAIEEPAGAIAIEIPLAPKTNQVELSGAVGDGSGQNIPLYARIILEVDDYSQTTYTNPFDGTYALTVYDDLAYHLTISALTPGYRSIVETEVTFSQPEEPLNYLLEITENCTAPGYGWVESIEDGISRQVCEPLPGAVLTGLVTNKHSGEPLVNAIISTGVDSVESALTPQDENLTDGFFWIFVPTQDSPQKVTISATRNLYLNKEVEIELHRSAVNRYDLQMVSYLNHVGLVFNNLSLLVWDYAQGLFHLVRGYLPL